jgi:hypothetical protein
MRSALCLAFLAALMNLIPCPVHAGQAPNDTGRCMALRSADFSDLQDAPAQVTSTTLVYASGDLPVYCQLFGYIMPQVGIEMRLPVSQWNGKLLEVGCGGMCGSTATWLQWFCDGALRKGYACIASDMGHRGTGGDGLWAYNNLQAEVDFGYRAAHVAALVGKAITARYYSRGPNRSYFMGCSQGGRQGMVEAQRFPWDFDGIVVGAPPTNYTANNMNLLWDIVASKSEDGTPMLSAATIELVHKAALARCDMDDGVKDGVIGNPATCQFDPSELACKAEETSGCLTNDQIRAVKKIYSGATTSTGENLSRGASIGSEMSWVGRLIGSDGKVPSITASRVEQFRWMSFMPSPGAGWQVANFNFNTDYKRLGMMEALYTASNPDLRKFKAAGGKLIAYQGWNDALAVPGNIIDYYETAERTMGGRAATQEFFRLFMIPGMDHCFGGDGAFAVDYLTYLEEWVEKDRPPERLVSSHVMLDDLGVGDEKSFAEVMRRLQFPLDPKSVVFSRPVYPYPTLAKYLGHGNPKEAASFGPAQP